MPSVIQRHEFADYLDVSTTDTPSYELMGTGFTTLDENPNAQTETKKYVNEKSSSTSITSYEPSFDFESDLIKSQEAVLALYKVGRNHMTGADAEFNYVRVELWDPAEGDETGNVFKARKFVVACEVSEMSGETDMHVNGSLHAVGDAVDGTFNVSTKTFTEV